VTIGHPDQTKGDADRDLWTFRGLLDKRWLGLSDQQVDLSGVQRPPTRGAAMTAPRRWATWTAAALTAQSRRFRYSVRCCLILVKAHVRHHLQMADERITARAGRRGGRDSWMTSTWSRARVMSISRHPGLPGAIVVGLSLHDGVTVVADRRGVSCKPLADAVVVRTLVIREVPPLTRAALTSLAAGRERITFRREWGNAIPSGLVTWTEHIDCTGPVGLLITLLTDQTIGEGLGNPLQVRP
jgi:hypothetical protein